MYWMNNYMYMLICAPGAPCSWSPAATSAPPAAGGALAPAPPRESESESEIERASERERVCVRGRERARCLRRAIPCAA